MRRTNRATSSKRTTSVGRTTAVTSGRLGATRIATAIQSGTALSVTIKATAGYRVPKDLSRALGPGQLTLWPGLFLSSRACKLAAAFFFPHTSAPLRTIEW
jgi:hypothetical protein